MSSPSSPSQAGSPPTTPTSSPFQTLFHRIIQTFSFPKIYKPEPARDDPEPQTDPLHNRVTRRIQRILSRTVSSSTTLTNTDDGVVCEGKKKQKPVAAATRASVPRRKVVFVGDDGVGKTAVVGAYSEERFKKEYIPTVFENTLVATSVDGRDVELALWDTAGQEEYAKVRALSYHDADVFVACFSIDSRASIESVEKKWIAEIRHHSPHTPVILMGLKADCREHWTKTRHPCISESKARRLATTVGAEAYVECCAKTGAGVREAVDAAARIALLAEGGGKKKKKRGWGLKRRVRPGFGGAG